MPRVATRPEISIGRAPTGSPVKTKRGGISATRRLSIGAVWDRLVESNDLADMISWPPDMYALVDRVLELSEAYRFLVSPLPEVDTMRRDDDVPVLVSAKAWWEFLDGTRTSPPNSVMRWWQILLDSRADGIEDLSLGTPWSVIEALLALHAIADEACAGLGTSTSVTPGPGCSFRAAARELLAETGSLSRISPSLVRVLPRGRTPTTGISIQSLSRHVCIRGPQVDVEWHRMLSRPSGAARPSPHANVVLFPWPLRVRARDFRPVPHSLHNMDGEKFGFFEFRPAETLDLDLVGDVLELARDEAGTVDIAVFPEAAITAGEIAPLEALLAEQGVWCLIAGVREASVGRRLGANWVHVGARQGSVWRHASQNKHHRWCLDGRQINQYHLGGALTPGMRWWEAVSIPRRSLQVIDMGAINFVPLLCEDLARLEPVADLVRSIGPSLVLTLLLDGPQLASRWTARYASVLADDPGSAVWTLTSYGMVRRCRPPGCKPSRVIGLWKDASGMLTEIELEEGADAVLASTNVTYGDSFTADGRHHPASTSDLTLVAVQPLQAPRSRRVARRGASRRRHPSEQQSPQPDEKDLSKLTSWLEAVAEAAMVGPESIERILSEAIDERWRAPLGLPAPSPLLIGAMRRLREEIANPPSLESLHSAALQLLRSGQPDSVVTGTLLAIAIEERVVTEVRSRRTDPHDLELLDRLDWKSIT